MFFLLGDRGPDPLRRMLFILSAIRFTEVTFWASVAIFGEIAEPATAAPLPGSLDFFAAVPPCKEKEKMRMRREGARAVSREWRAHLGSACRLLRPLPFCNDPGALALGQVLLADPSCPHLLYPFWIENHGLGQDDVIVLVIMMLSQHLAYEKFKVLARPLPVVACVACSC
jgi:hypothetical protein